MMRLTWIVNGESKHKRGIQVVRFEGDFCTSQPRIHVSKQRIFHMNVRLRKYKYKFVIQI